MRKLNVLAQVALAAWATWEMIHRGPGEIQLALGPLAIGLLGAGASALGGIFGGGGPESSRSTTTTSTNLGDLPPELQALLEQLYGQNKELSARLSGELLNLPAGLSYDALSQNPFGGALAEILNTSGLTPGVQKAFGEATTGSFNLARENLQQGLGFLEDQARRQASETTAAIRGQAGALGLRGSTAVGGRIAGSLEGINQQLGQAIAGGQSQLGQLGVANLQQRAAGLLQAQGLSQQARLGAGQLALGARQQQIGLRGLADSNLQSLLANPLIAQLFQQRLATSTTTSKTEGTQEGGGGVGSAFGSLGGLLLQNALGGGK